MVEGWEASKQAFGKRDSVSDIATSKPQVQLEIDWIDAIEYKE